MPLFNGGDPAIEFRKYIIQNLRYPRAAAEKGISGRVIVQFVVDTSGIVKDAKLVMPRDPLLDQEALRVVLSSPSWTPGKQRGRKVPVFFTFPIEFRLQEKIKPKSIPLNSTNIEPTFYVVEEMPEFNGGDPSREFIKYISENLVYPEEERQKGIQGRVMVQFVIKPDGSVSDVKVVTPDKENFNNAAVKVIESSPLWTPGKQRGKAVSVSFTVPVNFRLREKREIDEGSLIDYNNPLHSSKTAYYRVDLMPEYPGGEDEFLRFIMNKLRYPVIAAENRVAGEIMVDFVINEKGKIMPSALYTITDRHNNSPVVHKPIIVVGYLKPGDQTDQESKDSAKFVLEKEAYGAVLSSSDWIKPAIRDGKPVAVAMRIPVKFVLQ
jgi:TonB family protein